MTTQAHAILESARLRAIAKQELQNSEKLENERIALIVARVKTENEDSRTRDIQLEMNRDIKKQRVQTNKIKRESLNPTMPLCYNGVKVDSDMTVGQQKQLRAKLSNESWMRKNALLPETNKGKTPAKKLPVTNRKGTRSIWLYSATLDGKIIDLYGTQCSKCSKARKKEVTRNVCGHKNFNKQGLTKALLELRIVMTNKQVDSMYDLIQKQKRAVAIPKIRRTIGKKKLFLSLHKITM